MSTLVTCRPEPAITLPWRDPDAVFACFADSPHLAWLDSQGPVNERSRFSYLCIDPFEVVAAAASDPDPLGRLQQRLDAFRQPTVASPMPFTGGAVGYLSYELADRLDRMPRQTTITFDSPDLWFGLYDVVLGFDRLRRELHLFSSGLPETRPGPRAVRARQRADHILARLHAPARLMAPVPHLDWVQDTPRRLHMARVARAIAYIEAGDIYQANITARFLAARPPGLHAADLHLALRAANPAPYGAYLHCGDRLCIASVSPERFVGLTAGGDIETRPIKGSRPRGATPAADAALLHALTASEKDFAENLMIVDLMRNDIGRVAAQGSIAVSDLARPESFAHIHHLVSCVRGRLRPGLSAIDLLRATFPGGSITGAPKIRAMQIIAELEQAARGPYCGAIAWLGFDGAMDSNIAIRTVSVTPDLIAAQAGGGIVADSDPAEEWEELMVKIRPLLAALGDLPA